MASVNTPTLFFYLIHILEKVVGIFAKRLFASMASHDLSFQIDILYSLAISSRNFFRLSKLAEEWGLLTTSIRWQNRGGKPVFGSMFTLLCPSTTYLLECISSPGWILFQYRLSHFNRNDTFQDCLWARSSTTWSLCSRRNTPCWARRTTYSSWWHARTLKNKSFEGSVTPESRNWFQEKRAKFQCWRLLSF